MKDQILKIAKVKSEKEFYKKYPTEAAFMKAHGKAFKKAAMGAKMVETQLDQLTDFGNPPMAQVGTMIGGSNPAVRLKPMAFNDLMAGARATNTGITKEEQLSQDKVNALDAKNTPSTQGMNDLSGIVSGITDMAGSGDAEDIVGDLPIHEYGGHLYKYQVGGGLAGIGNAIGGAFGKQGGLGSGLIDMFGGKDTSKGIMETSQNMFKGQGLMGGLKQLGTSGGLKAAGSAAGVGLLNAAPQILQGFGQMKEQKAAIKKADQAAQISGLTAQAAESQPQLQKRRYTRPEDALVQPGQLGNPQGAGTNFLAQNGRSIGGNPTEIQNSYNSPLDIYSDLGFTPLNDDNVKQYAYGGDLNKAAFGDYFQDSGQASIGKGVGTALGSAFGPVGGMVGGFLGGIAGNALGGAQDAERLRGFQDQTKENTERAAWAQGAQNIHSTYSSNMEDGGWVSHDWQPQVITTFGEHKLSDLLQPPHDADMLRAGGHLREYTPPSAAAMYTGRAQNGSVLDSDIRYKTDLQTMSAGNDFNQNLRSATSSIDRYADGRPVEKTDMYSITRGQGDNQRVKEFLRTQTGDGAPQYSMQKTYKPLFSDQYKTVSRNIGAGRGERRMADMEQFLGEGKMEDGGQMAMGGDLQVHRGQAETMSYNPFLPDGGETVMFRGPSHDDGGMPISYGQNGVEVEGGEPAVKLQNGGEDENLVVFGNMVIPKYGVDEIGDNKAKGKKFKNYIADLSKVEAKQNKIIDKSTNLVNSLKNDNPFDQLSMNASRANLLGANMKLKDIADKKQRAAVVQNAILDTAKEYGVESDGLAKGQIKPIKDPLIGKNGLKLKKAQAGVLASTPPPAVTNALDFLKYAPFSYPNQSDVTIPYANPNLPEVTVTGKRTPKRALADIIKMEKGLPKMGLPPVTLPITTPNIGMAKGKGKKKFDWETAAKTVASGLGDLFRPRTKSPLDPSQLMGEMYALGSNQQEPVYAQTYQPMLDTPYDISLQDQINAIDSQSRAAIRAAGQDPSAQAYIMSQAADLKNKVLGEQMRINQANKAQVYQGNRAAINDAVLKNIGILDTQQVRQSTAKSKTKEQAIEALKSIGDKIAQNKLENRNMNVMENLYKYRFNDQGVAYNVNDPYFFNSPMVGSSNPGGLSEYEKAKAITNAYEKKTKGLGKDAGRNGAIVKALKNI